MRSINFTWILTSILAVISATSAAPTLPGVAAPLPEVGAPSLPAPGLPSLPAVVVPRSPSGSIVNVGDVGVEVEVEPRTYGNGLPTKTSIPDIIIDVSTQIGPITEEIHACISVGVDLEVIVPLLNKIHDLLVEAIAAVEFIIANPQEGVFFYAGRVLPLEEVAHLVATLFITVITILGVVYRAVATVQLEIIAPLVVKIATIVAHLLLKVFIISADLQGLVIPLIFQLKEALLYLNLASVLQLLGIQY